jgi:ABC-type sugar transport system ATPase subunit
VLDRPVNLFVGGFIGSPAMNMVVQLLLSEDDALAPERRRKRAVAGLERRLTRSPPSPMQRPAGDSRSPTSRKS